MAKLRGNNSPLHRAGLEDDNFSPAAVDVDSGGDFTGDTGQPIATFVAPPAAPESTAIPHVGGDVAEQKPRPQLRGEYRGRMRIEVTRNIGYGNGKRILASVEKPTCIAYVEPLGDIDLKAIELAFAQGSKSCRIVPDK